MQQVFRNARRISVNVLMIVKDQKSMFKIIQLKERIINEAEYLMKNYGDRGGC